MLATFSRRSPPLDIDHSKILNFSEKEAVTEHTLIRMAKRMRIHVYSLITAGAEEKFDWFFQLSTKSQSELSKKYN